MLKLPFKGTFPRTQDFNDPCCRSMYTGFGLCGHNGWDFGTSVGTELYAPHGGKITESTLDTCYGWYVKIENDIEASVVCHMREKPKVKVGDEVKQGETLLGLSGNTGNSTGPHVHWGYIRNPRNKNNGFNGYVDQTYFMDLNDGSQELQVMIESRDAWKTKCNEYEKKLADNEILLLDKDKVIEELRDIIATNRTPLSDYSWLERLISLLPKGRG